MHGMQEPTIDVDISIDTSTETTTDLITTNDTGPSTDSK